MYDLEILVPAEGEFKERFKDFKKWGITNVGNYKVKLILVASHDNTIDMFEKDYPNGVDVEVVITPYKHVAQRIYYYYDSIIKADTAKWYFRIDEDTMNDVSGLMKNLESLFDHEREYHLTGCVLHDVENIERIILCDLGFNDWFTHKHDTPPHDFEMSITSNAAMKRILNEEKAKKYFKIRKEKSEGYGDHGLCFCARMVKIHPTLVNFLTNEARFSEFSKFKGQYNHIHWVDREKNPDIINWLEITCPEKENKYLNMFFIFSSKDKANKKLISLSSNNRIEEILVNQNYKELIGLWSTTKDGKLFFNGHHENMPLMIFEETTNGKEDSTMILQCEEFELKTGNLTDILSSVF